MVEYQLEYSSDGTTWIVLQAWSADQSESLDTTALPDGPLLLRAKARDAVDLLEALGTPISVTVDNVTTRARAVRATAVAWAPGCIRTLRITAASYIVSTDTEQFYQLTATFTPSLRLAATLTASLRLSAEVV